MTSPRIAIASCDEWKSRAHDDGLLASALKERGAEVSIESWSDGSIDWLAFERVVIRSTWDYHHRVDEFRAWLRLFEAGPRRLLNPAAAVLGNLDKRYLLDLAAQGVAVVPTVRLEPGATEGLAEVAGAQGWEAVVVKPSVSASADGTWRCDATRFADEEERFVTQLREQALLVQPYLKEIEAAGEWSLVFLGGELSHALVKTPASGDFRVQEEHGGDQHVVEPPAGLVGDARELLTATEGKVGDRLTYARVDGVERDGRLLLMELEINEPGLFLELVPEAAGRFADVILS